MNRRLTIMLFGLLIGCVFVYVVQKQRNASESIDSPPPAPQISPPSSSSLPPAPPASTTSPAAPTLPASPSSPASPTSSSFISSPLNIQFANSEETTKSPSPGSHSHVIKEWKGQFSPSIRSLAANLGSLDSEQTISLTLPSGEQLPIAISKHTQFDETRGVFTGRIPDSPYSEVIFSYVNQAVSGSIMTPETGEVIEIKNAGNGYQYIVQVDATKLGSCGICAENKSNNAL